MRLAGKLTAALMLVFVTAFAVQTALSVRRTTALHEAELRDDLAIAARALGNGAGRIWTLEGEAAARAYVGDADERRARTRIAIVDSDQIHAPRAPTEADVLRGGNALSVTVPVHAGGAVVAGLELRRMVSTEREALLASIGIHLAIALALVLVCGVVALWLGARFIGRPIDALVAQARAVAKGRYEVAPALRRNDELGRLATEMNHMADQLAEAEKQVKRAQRSATALQQRLRHGDRLSMLGKLASTIAHELGTPLNVVSGRADIITSKPNVDEAIKRNATVIAEQARSMTLIIQQILDFARRKGLDRQRYRIAHVVEQAMSLIEPLAEASGVSLVLESDAKIEALLDEQKTLQVLTNLMVNGVQAMPDGGVIRLQVGSEEVPEPPDPRCEPGRYICIAVVDEGVGMSAKRIERIFEPFYTTKSEGEGTGLGLSVCQGIMREHGGFLTVDSEVGRGSTFAMFLPLEPAALCD